MSTQRQSDSFKVTQTCNWKPELLHPDLCPPYCRWLQTGVKPCSLGSGDASKLLTKVVWLIFSLRESHGSWLDFMRSGRSWGWGGWLQVPGRQAQPSPGARSPAGPSAPTPSRRPVLG